MRSLLRKYSAPLPYSVGKHSYDGSADYLQWWYFDAELECGHHVMMIMMPNAFGEIDDEKNGPDPGITFMIQKPDGSIINSRHFYPTTFSSDPKEMKVYFDGENSIVCENGKYRVLVNQGGIGCDLTFDPIFRPWPPFPGKDGNMFKPLLAAARREWKSDMFLNYASMIPKAHVTGKLFLSPDEEVVVKGQGYHEQGRLNSPFQKVFTYWYWTRFYLGDWTFVFPVAQAPKHAMNAVMRAVLVYHKDELVADMFDVTGVFLKHKVSSYQKDPEVGHKLPISTTFSARLPGFVMDVEMTLDQQIERFLFAPFQGSVGKTPGWYQHMMDVKANIRWKGKDYNLEGRGVFETMLTGAS